MRYHLHHYPFVTAWASMICAWVWTAFAAELPAYDGTAEEPTVAGAAVSGVEALPADETGPPVLPDSLHPDIKTVIPPGIFYGSFTKADGPFLIDGSVTVPSDRTLEFGPGSVVYVGGRYSTITVFGRIAARGTEEEPVIFMSARRSSNPWDWDRIYCRGRNRSEFEHCVIRHSNYGISAENGVINVKECVFERNSLCAVTVKNSEATLSGTVFRGGQVVALLLGTGATVNGEDLVITDNGTGIGCDGSAKLALTGGSIAGNGNGLVVSPEASVSITGTDISHNKIGLIAQKPIPKKNRETVKANGIDQKIVKPQELRAYLREPEPILSSSLSKPAGAQSEQQNFTPGFSSSREVQAPASSFIGSVTAGFRYFEPASRKHPLQDTLFEQTLYPTGLQPEMQIFANGKRGKTDVNLLLDMYSNPWLGAEGSVGKNTLNCGLTYDNHTLSFADFYENSSETSINGRQLTGIKYTGYYRDMGDGMRGMEYKLAAGETEVPRDSGRHDINQYNVTVDSGMSTRQQITYIMSSTLRPTRATTFTAEGVIARDQSEEPLLRTSLSDPGAPRPIEAQTGRLAGTMSFFGNRMELFAEVDIGSHDTIDTMGSRKVVWYNPELEDALPKIFNNFLSRANFLDHFAAVAGGRGSFSGYTLGMSYTEIAPHYFSAGNPYLEVNRSIARCNAERSFGERASISSSYEYERAMSSGKPIDRNTLNFRGDYAFKENKPAFSLNYTCRTEMYESKERLSPVSGSDSTGYRQQKLTNIINLEEKHSTKRATVSHGVGYQLLWDNDFSEHVDARCNDIGDRMRHQASGWLAFKLKTLFRNKISFRVTMKNENRDSLRSLAYKVDDRMGITLIPRKLNLTFSAEIVKKDEREFVSDTFSLTFPGWQPPLLSSFYGGDIEAKYSITPRLSVTVKGRYEQSADDIQSSRENYDAIVGGVHVTYLF